MWTHFEKATLNLCTFRVPRKGVPSLGKETARGLSKRGSFLKDLSYHKLRHVFGSE
jgi:hypothetical protein